MRLEMKNRSSRYDINSPRRRNGHKYTKYKICIDINDGYMYQATPKATFETQFMKKLNNTEADLKKKHCSSKKRVRPAQLNFPPFRFLSLCFLP